MRLLYDYFIFKRNEKDDPLLFEDKNLYSIKYANNKKNILMLQLLFNFTSPQYFAQDWISIVLAWLNKNIEYIGKDDFYTKFESFLEDFDKDLAKIRLSSNISIIEFINKKLIDLTETITDFNLTNLEKKLNKGTSTQHYWFYKLDYLLWKDYKKYWKKENNSIKILENVKIDNFRLKRLNSIEHIQPQNPEQNCKDWNNDEFNIDNFGNLALISNHMNSTLTNQCFDTKKKDIEKQLSKGTIESLKMLLVYSKYDKWTPENCKDHQEEMIGILKNSIIKTD